MRWMVLALGLMGCSGSSDDVPVDPVEETGSTGDTAVGTTPTTEPTIPSWQKQGQDGSIVVRNSYSRAGGRTYEVYGLFANKLSGFHTAAWCAFGNGPCAGDLPPFDEAIAVGETISPDDLKNFTWNGDFIGVNTLQAPFLHDPNRGTAYYKAIEPDRPEDEISNTMELSFDGEWGAWEGGRMLLPLEVGLVSPSPRDGLSRDLRQTITWNPIALGDMVVRVVINGKTVQINRLEDDGEWELNLEGLVPPGATEVSIFVGRWVQEEYEVNGNQLWVTLLTEVEVAAR